jgi:salicylate hydroxylase
VQLAGLNIAVIGAGIGGTAAATAFAQRGATVRVFEQAPELTEVGAGLQVSANGQAVLRALGSVGTEPPAGASVSAGTVFRDGRSGRRVATVAPPKAGPTWYMHRADLLSILVKSAREAGVTFDMGRVVTPGTVNADLIIAADGVKSVWRNQVDGPDSPQFTGQVAWRAVVPWDKDSKDVSASLSMGHRAHVVSYPLRAGKAMNLVAIEERTGWAEEGWSLQGDSEEFRKRFADFGGDVGQLINKAQHVHQWALHARPVARTWARGSTVLLGDAAHPTLPFMAQGACLALEDAWVLSACLSQASDMTDALMTYERLRRPRAEKVVALAKGNAWRFHMGKPFAWGAQAVLAVGAGALARRLEWVYSYDATQVV